MRIILVHGINNENNSSEGIIDGWLAAIKPHMDPAIFSRMRSADIAAPFYGKVLHEWTEKRGRGAAPIAQAAGDPDSDEARFYKRALEEFLPAVGVSESEIRAMEDTTAPVEQGLPHDRRLLALLRALETISPLKGQAVLRLIPQAFTYLNRQGATRDIDQIVRPYLSGDPCIVIAHSLGTIVTFRLLRGEPGADVPFYLTLGSPLAVQAVKLAIGPPFGRCSRIKRWVNAIDPNDAVTVGRALTPTTFGNGIENIGDVDNGSEDPHSVARYLTSPDVVAALTSAL